MSTTMTERKTKPAAIRPAKSITTPAVMQLQELVEPFGWKVRTAGLDADELTLIDHSLNLATAEKPLYDSVWNVIDLPQRLLRADLFGKINDAKALARALCFSRKTLNGWLEDHKNGVSDNDLAALFGMMPRETQTPSGTVFVEPCILPGQFAVWFGRKTGKAKADLTHERTLPAVRALFNIPQPAAVNGKAKLRRVDRPHKPAAAAAVSSSAAASLQVVPLEKIQSSPDNHRKAIDAAELQQLADSIAKHGILQPLLLRPLDGGRFEIIAGERRFRAASIANLQAVPAQIVERGGLQASLAMWEENVRRVDLSPIERAQAIRGFMEAHGLKQTEVAKLAGVSQGQISNELRLLQLPADWQKKVAAGDVAPSAIRPILPFADCPGVFAALEVEMERWKVDDDPLPEEDFRRAIDAAIDKASRSMRFEKNWNAWQAPREEERHFETVSPADLKRLDVRKVGSDVPGLETSRAFNVELFDQLNADPMAARLKKHQAKVKAEKAARPKSGNAKTKSGVFAADAWKLKQECDNTLRPLFADALKSTKNKLAAQRVCLIMAIMQEGELSELISGSRAYQDGFMAAVASAIDGTCLVQMVETIRAACLESLSDDYHWMQCAQMLTLAKLLGVDLLQRWKPSAEVLGMLTPAGLQKCCQAIEFDSDTKDAAAIVAAWPAGFVPEFFREPLGINIPKTKRGAK